jgi:serine/threonine-protein kinase
LPKHGGSGREPPPIEGYRILEELGSGALSTVYAAVEEPLGRVVALKVLRSTIAPSSPFAQQLEREAKVLAELCHPNVGQLYAFSKSETRLMLVLEFVDGFSLASLLTKRPVLPPDSVAAIGAAVARGLSHAHERGVVHRDIKPANVLVSRRGEVKIFDFGIAQRLRASDEQGASPSAGSIPLAPMRLDDAAAYGTPAYMSPEQILGEAVDARSDLFSLGVVLYQLVCGARPFERGDGAEGRPAAHRIRRDPPIPLHRRAPDVPVALERIVMRAIEKAPADRFQSAEAMAQQLEELATPRSGLSGDRMVIRALEAVGVVGHTNAGASAAPARRKQETLRRAIAGLAAIGAVVVAGGGALQASGHRRGDTGGASALELVPASPGYLRVLATPWAELWIDGQRIDVTPIARPIPLTAGLHYVTLVHPHAPIEKRTLSVAAGEVQTVDVVMAVGDDAAPAGASVPPRRSPSPSDKDKDKEKKR